LKHTKGEPQLADWGTMIRRAVPPASDDHDPSIVLTRDPVALGTIAAAISLASGLRAAFRVLGKGVEIGDDHFQHERGFVQLCCHGRFAQGRISPVLYGLLTNICDVAARGPHGTLFFIGGRESISRRDPVEEAQSRPAT
jgi:hypothetical protein